MEEEGEPSTPSTNRSALNDMCLLCFNKIDQIMYRNILFNNSLGNLLATNR